MKRTFLLALPLVLFCANCANPPLEIATPPAERFAPVAEPEIPAGDTDAEVADYIRRLVEWGRANVGKLEWLGDWRESVTR